MKIEAHRKILLAAILTLLFIPLLTNPASGDDSISEFKLTAGIDAAANDQFGYSVDISGDWAVVGAPNGESVFLYKFDGTDWEPLEKPLVTPTSTSPPTPISYFGWDVAIDGDTLVVSDFNSLWLIGSVYVYTRTGDSWDEGKELKTGLGVGASVAIDGNTILVGAPLTGFTYVFTKGATGWEEEEKDKIVSPLDSLPFFGWDVDLSGDTAVVGAPLMGFAYVFTRNEDSSWDEGQELITGPWVGSSVAIDGETVVVGAPSLLPVSSQVPQGPGSAYVFRKDANGSWQQQELPNPGVDGFGASVAIREDRVLVGAPTDDIACPDDPFCNSGSVRMFQYDGESWIQDPHHPVLIPMLEPSPEESDEFGWALAIDGSRIAVGARFGDAVTEEPPDAPTAQDVGSASVFILAPPNQPPIAIAEAIPNEIKEGKRVNLEGSESYDPDDPDDDQLTYEWVQTETGGPHAELSDPTAPDPFFIAPELTNGCATLEFELTVSEKGEGGLSSDPPARVEITVLPNNKIHSTLGRSRHRFFPAWEIFEFTGAKDDIATLIFEADANGNNNHGKGVSVMVRDKIRGVHFFSKNRWALGNTMKMELPADGEYMVVVFGHPWFFRSKGFRGDYWLKLDGPCGKLRKRSRGKKW